MPEPVELCVRRRQRRWMAVPQRHDGDSPAEVEVVATVGVPDAAAVATNKGQIGARVCREQALEPL